MRTPVDPIHWFLGPKTDVRSTFYLVDVATEFQVQGLRHLGRRLPPGIAQVARQPRPTGGMFLKRRYLRSIPFAYSDTPRIR